MKKSFCSYISNISITVPQSASRWRLSSGLAFSVGLAVWAGAAGAAPARCQGESCNASGVAAPQARPIAPLARLRTPVVYRAINQPLNEVILGLGAAAGVNVAVFGQLDAIVSDWSTRAPLTSALQSLAATHGLCVHFDGTKLLVSGPDASMIRTIDGAGKFPEAQRVLRFTLPWSSSNALAFKPALEMFKICGPAAVVAAVQSAVDGVTQNTVQIIRAGQVGQ